MALALGTNCGFVTEAPVADPGGTASTIDTWSWATKHTSPADAVRITEIGWWCDNATQEANFEVGLYSHDAGNDKPDSRLQVDNTNAKGTGGAEWKSVSVNWSITAETIYWIAVQVDNTATATSCDWGSATGSRTSIKSDESTLPATWNAGSSQGAYAVAIYAVYSTEAGEETGILSCNSKFWG
jgi:hypothetical protein